MIDMILGDYRIAQLIGFGGMAKVYLANHIETGDTVAVKILPEEFYDDASYQLRFLREIEVIQRLNHPNILPLISYGEKDRHSYIVMPYMKYGTLRDRISDTPLPPDDCLRLLKQLGSALDHAHEQNIIHRDIKPSNILIDADNNVKLVDFGVAKLIEDTPTDITGSAIVGTLHYMSPEQCMGDKDLTYRTDIYALGMVLHEMLSGRSPFGDATAAQIISRYMSASISLANDLDDKLSPEVKFVIMKALARKPTQRHKNGAAFAKAFERAIQGGSPL